MQSNKQKELAEEPDPIKNIYKKKLAKTRKNKKFGYTKYKLRALLFLGCSL
jgi:hypothetical protein